MAKKLGHYKNAISKYERISNPHQTYSRNHHFCNRYCYASSENYSWSESLILVNQPSQIFALFCLFLSIAVSADESKNKKPWQLQTSLYTKHYHDDGKLNNHQNLVELEYHREDNYLIGAALFNNSYRQFSQYVYVGKLWRPIDNYQYLHIKLTGGLLHGYRDEHKDAIPLNGVGIAPVIVPAIGLSDEHLVGEIALFGRDCFLITAGLRF